MTMKKIFLTLVLLSLCEFCFSQSAVKKDIRMQQAEKMFKNALIKHFIHPNQLEEESWAECQVSIQSLVEKFEEDFLEIKIEKAFKNADVTNYFRPIFIYADGREFSFSAFKIMQ